MARKSFCSFSFPKAAFHHAIAFSFSFSSLNIMQMAILSGKEQQNSQPDRILTDEGSVLDVWEDTRPHSAASRPSFLGLCINSVIPWKYLSSFCLHTIQYSSDSFSLGNLYIYIHHNLKLLLHLFNSKEVYKWSVWDVPHGPGVKTVRCHYSRHGFGPRSGNLDLLCCGHSPIFFFFF